MNSSTNIFLVPTPMLFLPDQGAPLPPPPPEGPVFTDKDYNPFEDKDGNYFTP
jgi:hypothetical protein